jgi:hypothetical protein
MGNIWKYRIIKFILKKEIIVVINKINNSERVINGEINYKFFKLRKDRIECNLFIFIKLIGKSYLL